MAVRFFRYICYAVNRHDICTDLNYSRIVMVKKATGIFLLCCIALSMGWLSCKKKEEPATQYTRMLGKWKKVRYATDDNANGALDEWEMRELPDGLSNTLEFKKDSTGTESATFSPDLKFRWFIGGDVGLLTVYNTGDSVGYKVVLLTSANLHLTTKTKLGLAGYYYDKTK